MFPQLIKSQQEEAVKNWRKNFIDYGMTPSTTDNPPEGFYDFVEEPETVEPWIEDIISQTVEATVMAVVGMIPDKLDILRSRIWSESQADFGSLRGGHDAYLIKKQDLNKVIDEAKKDIIQALKGDSSE